MFGAATTPDWIPANGPLAEGASVLALMEAARGSFPRLGSVIKDAGSALAIVERRVRLRGPEADTLRALLGRIGRDDLEQWIAVLGRTLERSKGVRFVPITDSDYPAELAGVSDCPPFLFARGDISAAGAAPVAVVGSRAASPDGRALAGDVGRVLALGGSTVVSGLALGIDSEAHLGCLAAGGRTIASLPSGVDRIYPEEHARLASAIAAQGCLISRFWPDAPPRRDSFRLRNAVTSGIALATVVIEAGPTSGARMQVRIALEQQRPVVLMRHLVDREPWAARAATRRGMFVADRAEDVLEIIGGLERRQSVRQLALF